jgi:hypothetical protein
MPLDLLDQRDPLIQHIPAEFIRAFDPGQCSRRLSPWIVRTDRFSRPRLAVAEWLRQGWCKQQLTECRVLNDARYLAVCRALDEEIAPLEIAWAIVAYGRECGVEKARIANPLMRRTFESFLSEALERYIPLGSKLRQDQLDRKRRTAERAEQHRQQNTHGGLESAFDALSIADRNDLVAQALRQLEARGTFPGAGSYSNPIVKSKALQILQRRMEREGKQPVPVGSVLDQALSA